MNIKKYHNVFERGSAVGNSSNDIIVTLYRVDKKR